MSSEKRIQASRANGARSRDLKTAAGKARSSQNAITHGLFAKSVVTPREDREAYECGTATGLNPIHRSGANPITFSAE